MVIQKWIIKALVQKTISILPYRQSLNFFFQKYVTGGIELSEVYWGYKIKHASDHINFYKNYYTDGLKGKTALELGTGWYPIIPVCLFLSNAEKIISIDIQSWMTKSFQLKAITKIIESREKGELQNFITDINEDRWALLLDIIKNSQKLSKEEINKKLCLETIIKDARKTGITDNSIDFICSNNTFEHIGRIILFDILQEFRRIIRTDGFMSHFIDMSDHFSHYDTTITNYNFLKFNEKVWNIIDNNIQPQNRLRFIDYKKMYQDLKIPITKEIIIGSKAEELSLLKVSEQYKKYSQDDLGITHAYIISKMHEI